MKLKVTISVTVDYKATMLAKQLVLMEELGLVKLTISPRGKLVVTKRKDK